MLTRIRRTQIAGSSTRITIVASQYNARFVDGMLRHAKRVLRAAGVRKVRVIRVPGAFEIPVVVAKLVRSGNDPPDAVICLGVIVRGQTSHAQLIAESVTNSLAKLQVKYALPIVHEVLLLENIHQAKVRCLSRTHNRGAEAAATALAMARLVRSL